MQKTVKCKFRGVSSGKYGYTIGLSVDRGDLPLDQADGLLVGSRLKVELSCDPNSDSDAKGQQTMGDCSISVVADAESRGISVLEDHITMSLKIHKDDVDVATLDQLCYHDGSAALNRVGDAKADE